MDIIPSVSYKSLTKYNNFSYCLLIVNAYYKIPKLYGMKNIITKEVMEKIDMFRAISGKVDKLSW